MNNDDFYTFDATYEHETDQAILLECGEDEPVWFPRSQLEDNGDGTWTVPEWLALAKGII